MDSLISAELAPTTGAAAADPPSAAPSLPAAARRFSWLALTLMALAGLLSGAAALADPDLGHHLAAGEWIWRHGAVPFAEPFAWTRAGQPYYAYSWLAEVLYYGLLRLAGPLALHVLVGALAAGAVGATLWAGRQMGWSAPARLGVALLHLCLFWGVATEMRPQQFLWLALPLAWGLAARIQARGISALRLLGLVGVGALAANTHLFFPLTAAPILWLAAARGSWRRWAAALAALVAGWLCSPYALDWPRVFALNFHPGVLLRRPPSIAEFIPGFEWLLTQWAAVLVVLALVAVPWVLARSAASPRERLVRALAWCLGLALFAYAGRLVLVWWVLAFPALGEAVERAIGAARAALRTQAARLAVLGGCAALLLSAAPAVHRDNFWFEGDVTHRMLPRAADDPVLWLPGWLLCHTRPNAGGRLFTEFNFGSELTWRLPRYSPSIDGRTIFPDSDAADFAFSPYGQRQRHATTWRGADVAMIEVMFWLTPVLEQDPSWVLLAESRMSRYSPTVALWARRTWWRQWGTAGDIPARGITQGDPRATCAATGVFPPP